MANNEVVKFGEIVQMSLGAFKRFKQIESRKWEEKAILLELMVEIGALGRCLTIFENYRYGKKSRHNLADELSDILFVLARFIQEKGLYPFYYSEIIVSSKDITLEPEQAFFRLIHSADELAEWDSPPMPDDQSRILREMISIVGGLAIRYQIPLLEAHKAEMDFVALWQKLFFDSIGRKRKRAFFRKVYWGFAGFRHVRLVEKLRRYP